MDWFLTVGVAAAIFFMTVLLVAVMFQLGV
jgi:hypothetical protein